MAYQLIREYSGLCSLNFVFDEKISISSSFRLKHYSNGKIVIECSLDVSNPLWGEIINMNNRGLVKVDLNGELDDSIGKIKVIEAVIDKINIAGDNKKRSLKVLINILPSDLVEIILKENDHLDKIHIGLTNFTFRGCERFRTGEISFKFDRFRINIGGNEILFVQKQNYKSLYEDLRENRGILVTSKMIIDSKMQDLDSQELIENICFLLSYASGTLISPIYEDYFSNEVLIKSILKPILTRKYNHQNAVIDSNHITHCDLKTYLETVYHKYTKYKDKLGLPIVIDYYLESARSTYLETKFLMGITALECFLSHFEEKLVKEGNPLLASSLRMNKSKILKIFEKDSIKIPEETLEKIIHAVSFPSPFLNDKLKALINYYTISSDNRDLELIRIRNNIVHEGQFPTEIRYNSKKRKLDNFEEYNRLINFIDRIILSILEYKGEHYLDRRNRSQRKILN